MKTTQTVKVREPFVPTTMSQIVLQLGGLMLKFS